MISIDNPNVFIFMRCSAEGSIWFVVSHLSLTDFNSILNYSNIKLYITQLESMMSQFKINVNGFTFSFMLERFRRCRINQSASSRLHNNRFVVYSGLLFAEYSFLWRSADGRELLIYHFDCCRISCSHHGE